ncbi:MAG TPA: Glu-tRNA(Gln) amidotransferase subunit GatE [Candidatus Thermoplasmatota archaeon]|nr:Glu-tRNA(Gln) amidotransferase subunit GatE [Candidatus Thermoplasmatota archaeon]
MASGLDYKALGFKCGLEIHQQLDTAKLFCRCPSVLDETDEAHVTFRRTLRPTQSELGETDRAALAEARKNLSFEYVGSRASCCLVEMDEEPPHPINPDAVDVALTVALLMNMHPVDEVHVMRKIVIDGSNTGGFQRTAMLALEGRLESPGGAVGIATMALEEDSARKLDRKGDPGAGSVRNRSGQPEAAASGEVVAYRLDRLGIPLIEIATAPDIQGPQHAREIAEAIGMALRATGRVKRGLGTIRQDLNVSIREGARVEIKGVQDLKLIATAVEWEVARQVKLLDVRGKLLERGVTAASLAAPLEDVTAAFEGSESKMIQGTLKAGGRLLVIRLPGFAGLIESKATAGDKPRLGRELADYAKVRAGVKGIFHSDELPAYGITAEQVAAVRARLGLAERDAFVLVAEKEPVARKALEAVRDRALLALEGVPEETRDMQDDGSSSYLRPLPGGARMYPETDVPPFTVEGTHVARLRGSLPEMLPEKLARFKRQYADLGDELIQQIVRGGDADAFERLVKATGMVKDVGRTLVSTLAEVEQAGVPREKVGEGLLLEALQGLKAGTFAKEAIAKILAKAAQDGLSAEKAAEALGLKGGADDGALAAEIDEMIRKDADLVRARGLGAQGPLMGPIMAKYRGKVPGNKLSEILKARIEAFLATK